MIFSKQILVMIMILPFMLVNPLFSQSLDEGNTSQTEVDPETSTADVETADVETEKQPIKSEVDSPSTGKPDEKGIFTEKSMRAVENTQLISGIFPNMSGNFDLKFHFKLQFGKFYGFGIYIDYISYTNTAKLSRLSSTTIRKDFEVGWDIIKFIFPLVRKPKKNLFFSIEPGINARYFLYNSETNGYRENVDESITYFLLKQRYNQLAGSVFVDMTFFFDSIEVDLRGEYFPYMFISETGSRQYSNFDSAVDYSNLNGVMGSQITVSSIIPLENMIRLPLGEFKFVFAYLKQWGKYASEAKIPRGNWLTTINSYEALSRDYFTFSYYYRMSFLKSLIKFIPSLGITYQIFIEKYGEDQSKSNLTKLGFTLEF